jgi:hypothetical protein
MNTNGHTELHMIPTTQLWADEAYQPRDSLSESHVRLLLASDPATWPPLLVAPSGDGRFRVIDGFHRLEAATRLGLAALPCVVDPSAGYPEGFAANLTHGLPLSLAERKAFARWLADAEPGLSYRELGRRSGLNHQTVKRALEEPEATGGDHRQSPPDPICTLVRQVTRTYRAGGGRTWLGFGRDGDAKAFRREIDAYDPDDQPEIARAMLAFGHACVAAAQPYLTEAM